jgi:CRISPR/Cas system-associated exonuclease Cas4 (RecB family)
MLGAIRPHSGLRSTINANVELRSMRITKFQFLNFLECPTKMWFDRRIERESLTSGEQLRRDEGQEIGKLARQLFPEGILVDLRSIQEAAKKTQELLKDTNVPAIFEATFIVGDFVTRADILVRDGDKGWTLFEVKSSVHKDGKIDDDHVKDLAYTTMVILDSGLRISRIELIRLSKEWQLGLSVDALFVRTDCLDEVIDTVKQFEELAPEVRKAAKSKDQPDPRLTSACKDCRFFADFCLGRGVEHPVIEVPRLSKVQFNQLQAFGVLDARNIPAKVPLTDPQRRVVNSVKSGKVHLDRKSLALLLDQVAWPCHYLDFETVKSAIPFWPEVGPHEQVPTQFSLHVMHGPEEVVVHHEYLARHTDSSTREFAETMLSLLGKQGSIVVYHKSFEKSVMNHLAKRHEDLKSEIDAVIERLFDLEDLFKEAIWHPDFRGKTSIKKTLPALVPDMKYDEFAISNGDDAIAAFVRMAKNQCSDEEIATIRGDLLRYCHQDTLAMAKLHRVVLRLLEAPGGSRVGDRILAEVNR